MDTTVELKKYTKVQELAELCGVTDKTIYSWVDKGLVVVKRIPPAKVTPTARPCNRIRFTRAEVKRVLRRIEQGLPVG